MDNSESAEAAEVEPSQGTATHTLKALFSPATESNVDYPAMENQKENGSTNGYHSEESEQENGKNIFNGHSNEDDICQEAESGPKSPLNLSLEEESSADEPSQVDEVEPDPEIPFSEYMSEKKNIDGAGDRKSQCELSSPTKISNGMQLRRIISTDVYPDKEAEEYDLSDNSSDEEEDDVLQANLEVRGSPKSRRKQRDSCHSFLWTDDQSHASTMHHLDVFRRSKQFCDLILQVGGREIHCHRVVVGGLSRFLYKELVQGEQDNNAIARISLNQIQPALSPEAVESLVDYMYTAKLMIPQGQLTLIYSACVRLKVERVIPVCRRHITNQLDVENCVETWRLASSVDDLDLLTLLNEFIEENFESITKTNEFLSLPRIKMVVISSNVHSDVPPFQVLPRDNALSRLALSWVKRMVVKHGGRYMEELTEQIQRVTLEELTNTLSVATSSSTSNASSPGSNKQTLSMTCNNDSNSNKSSPMQRLSRASSIDSLLSSGSENPTGQEQCKLEGRWSMIASVQTADHMIALCNFGDILSTVSLHLPTTLMVNGGVIGTNGPANSVSASSSSSHSCASSVGSVSELSHLTNARCAAGVTSLCGKIYALGGYNKSECLDSVECYDPATNKWSMLARMGGRRARFTAAVLNGQIYAVGGSTGSKDLISVERYDPASDKWFEVPSLPMRCSGVGVAVMNDLLYCVGGQQQSTGVAGIKLCHVFDPEIQAWQYIAPLNTGRSFPAVAELNGILHCVGGTDGWACLASVERFNGEEWIRGPNLNVPRRGAGLARHNDTLYCVGGSDGGSFWASVEQYSPEMESWTMVQASMTVPRSNVGLVSLNGLLFAVGGFSGRQFLSSVETMDEGGEEWTTHDAHIAAVAACNGSVPGEDSTESSS